MDAPEGITLTDFQVRLLKALRDVASVSVSAPTSAGKSFTLELDLLRRLTNDGAFVAIFLVPTRALIHQVSFDLIDLLKRHRIDCSILSSPSVPSSEVSRESPQRVIFVLTQERFATLLAEAPADFSINSIIVDEAHEIGKGARGITLERVIRLAMRRFEGARLFRVSPFPALLEGLAESGELIGFCPLHDRISIPRLFSRPWLKQLGFKMGSRHVPGWFNEQ